MSSFVVSRVVATDRDAAFADWIVPARMRTWWWPQWPDTVYRLDARPDRAWEIRSPSAGAGVSGRYTEVVPGASLGFTWEWDGAERPDRVLVLFSDDRAHAEDDPEHVVEPSRTEVTVVHVAPGRPVVDDHVRGWNDVLDRLPGRIA